jgi:hypothetical protein
MAPKVKLVYFSVRGKGEIIRLLMHAGKVLENWFTFSHLEFYFIFVLNDKM